MVGQADRDARPDACMRRAFVNGLKVFLRAGAKVACRHGIVVE
jgi:hypothetical protein